MHTSLQWAFQSPTCAKFYYSWRTLGTLAGKSIFYPTCTHLLHMPYPKIRGSCSSLQRNSRTLFGLLKKGTYLGTPKDKAKHSSFVMMRAAKLLVHHAKYRCNINKTMCQEIIFFREKLRPSSSILRETPIAHIIPWMPTETAFGNSCLEGAEGYSISIGFWWHLPFSEKVIQQTLIHKRQQGWSAHLNQQSRIHHGYDKLLCIPACVHNKEHNRQPAPCTP